MNRRQALKSLAAAAATPLLAQAPPAAPAAPARRPPALIVFSQNLSQIEYPELGDIVKQMGFDGVDLTVRPGGHVEPRIANVDLVRALEVMGGNGLSVPVVTTALTTPTDRTAVPVIALSGMSKVPLFRPGNWPYGPAANLMMRLAEVQRDFFALVNVGRQYQIAAAFYNSVGDHVGASVWDIQKIIEPIDPAWAGIYFDICNATAGGGSASWDIALRLALPRLKAVSIQDFIWEKQNDKWRVTKCPLGKGMVEWPKFFQMLAQANFTGPVTIEVGYAAKDNPMALVDDLQFARKQLQTAWGVGTKT